MARIIGIDLGTTHSAAAVLEDAGPRLIKNPLNEILTPSVVGLDKNGHVLVGRAAVELQVVQPGACAALFKRHMGSEWTVKLNDREFRPEQLSAYVLSRLKEDAESDLGEPVDRAVITVPAYFNDNQRKATIHAGEIAGLRAERIINEPTAAAIAYGLHQSEDEKAIVVFDLGGGTFDVSIVEMFDGVLEVRSSSGESFLGGEDFTRSMASQILRRRGMAYERAEMESPLLVSRLIQQCEQAKRKLSQEQQAEIRIPNEVGEFAGEGERETVTRDDFIAWTDNIVARIERPVRRALGDSRRERSQIDEVLLVGGATRMPRVVQLASEFFSQQPKADINPDEVVALGAAVQAGLIEEHACVEDLVVTDVAPFTLGVSVGKEFGSKFRDGYFLPILHRNSSLPASETERVCTVTSNQTAIHVKVYQGESRRVEDNLFLGEFNLEGIPLGPPGQEIDLRFTYDLNGVLEVEATVVATRKSVSHVITRHAQGMSKADVQSAVREMQKHKRHPRDEESNRFLLHRAERVFRELPAFHRATMEQLLTGFEYALEQKQQPLIEEFRQELERFLSLVDSPDDTLESDDD